MGYYGIIDCGTTNSRIAIVDETGKVYERASAKIGVKDSAALGSNAVLKSGLEILFREAVSRMGIASSDIQSVFSSGMITSELGIMEIPHLVAPAGLGELSASITKVAGENRLDIEPDLYLIRGIKNVPNPPADARLDKAYALDFMRGEETQIMGLLSLHGKGLSSTVINLSSHTKFIPIDKADRIQGSITTLSGQVYESILKETFIGKSVTEGKKGGSHLGEPLSAKNLEEAMDLAENLVTRSGLLRSLMLPRFMDTLMTTDWRIRKRFVESCLIADDLKALNLFPDYGFDLGERIFLVGLRERCEIFEYLFRKSGRAQGVVIQSIHDPEEVGNLAILGAISIARGAGLIQ
jgi:2-dehydro-3-deoxygalactonokinase